MKIVEKKWELRDITTLVPYEKNAKKHDDAQVSRIAKSIEKFGWRGNPILVDVDGVIISGHGRRLAAMKLGLAKVPVMVETDMTAQEARAFRLADNRAGEGGIDNDILKEELIDLDFDLDGIFDKKELDFAVTDVLVMNDNIFEDNIATVMDEQTQNTNSKVEQVESKRIPITKLLDFKDVSGSDAVYVTRFMAQLQAEGGASPEASFMSFVKGLVGKLA